MKSFFRLLAAAAAVLLAGCSTPVLRLTMNVPGEIKIPDTSKIAVLDFNSIPGDAFTGTGAADQQTCAIVQRAVCAALSRSGAWDVSRLDVEAAVAKFDPAVLPSRRFDAVAVGRVWWQYPPETDILEPRLFTLETKTRVSYQVPGTTSSSGLGSSLGGLGSSLGSLGSSLGALSSLGSSAASSRTAPTADTSAPTMIDKTIDLTTEKKDVLEKIGHRTREATLMLALSIYRLRSDGTITKVTDTFVELDQTFSLENGDYSSKTAEFGAPGANAAPHAAEKQDGVTELPATAATIPSDLQAKLMLAARAAEDLGRRISTHKTVRTIPYDFDDPKLLNLLQNRAWNAAEQYALKSIRTALGAEVAERFAPLEAYPKPDYEVPPSREGDIEEVSVPDAAEAAAAAERLVGRRDALDAVFGLAVCQEATGRAEEALYTYRCAFRIEPEEAFAQGIARCHEALGAAARIAEQARSVRKAGRHASLE